MPRRTREAITVPVGTRVLIPFPSHKMAAEVIEHRGFIGVGGREMVRIRSLASDDDSGAFDVPVDEIEVVSEQRAGRGHAGKTPESRKSAPERVRVGTRVRYRLPAGVLEAEVIEDRGFIRQGGEQVVRIRTIDEPDFPDEFDTPVRLLDVVDPPDDELAA